MKKKIIVLLLAACLMLSACGNAAKVTKDVMQTNEAAEAEESTEENASGKEEAADETSEKEAEETQETEKMEASETPAKEEADAEKTDTEETVTEETPQPSEAPKEITEEITIFEQSKVMYAISPVNVRRGPSTDYEVVSYLSTAQQVETTGQAETGWYQILIKDEPAYVSHKYLSETKIEVPTPAPTDAPQQMQQPTAQPEQQPAPQQAQQPAPTDAPQPAQQQIAVAPAGVIMVGDSRCVQMKEAVGGGGCMWICENSKEYTWFVEKAIPNFDKHVGNGTKVVINMGVNDPEHYRQYAETINAKAAEWAQRGAKTYLVSVNPVWENPYTTKEQVDTFNANVPGMLSGVTWIDSHTWLVENGYRILDGLHYDAPTSVNIFNFIMAHL